MLKLFACAAHALTLSGRGIRPQSCSSSNINMCIKKYATLSTYIVSDGIPHTHTIHIHMHTCISRRRRSWSRSRAVEKHKFVYLFIQHAGAVALAGHKYCISQTHVCVCVCAQFSLCVCVCLGCNLICQFFVGSCRLPRFMCACLLSSLLDLIYCAYSTHLLSLSLSPPPRSHLDTFQVAARALVGASNDIVSGRASRVPHVAAHASSQLELGRNFLIAIALTIKATFRQHRMTHSHPQLSTAIDTSDDSRLNRRTPAPTPTWIPFPFPIPGLSANATLSATRVAAAAAVAGGQCRVEA